MQSIIFNTIYYDFNDSNYTNKEILSSIVQDIINNYNGKSNVIKGINGMTLQITTEDNELDSLNGIKIINIIYQL